MKKKMYKKGTKAAKKSMSKDGMYAMTSRTFNGMSGSDMVSGYTMGPAKKAKSGMKMKKKG